MRRHGSGERHDTPPADTHASAMILDARRLGVRAEE